jgi:MscS family membrane protein
MNNTFLKSFSWCSHTTFSWCWIFDVAIVLAFTLLCSGVIYLIYRRLHPRLVKTNYIWDDSFLKALHPALQVIVWLIGIAVAFDVMAILFTEDSLFLTVIHLVRNIGIAAAFLWFFLKYISYIETRLLKTDTFHKKERDKTTVYAVGKLARIVAIVIVVLVVVQLLGLPMSGVATFIGAGALGMGFGAKDMLSNVIGGLMLHLDRPFKVGNWIRSSEKDIEGDVEYIGWRSTRIRNFSKAPIYVPNSTFLSITVENVSRMSYRRIKTVFGVRYQDAKVIHLITRDVEIMLRRHPEIAADQTLYVKLTEFAASSLNIVVNTYTKTVETAPFQHVQQDIFLKIIEIVHQHGADFAFPTTTLDLPNNVEIRKKEV